jgi:hypothetical protein
MGKGFINRPFSYIKHCCDNDIAKGHCYSDRDNEEGHLVGNLVGIILLSWRVHFGLCKLLFYNIIEHDFFNSMRHQNIQSKKCGGALCHRGISFQFGVDPRILSSKFEP